MREAITFDDVLIVPKFSTIESRKDVNIGFKGLDFSVNIPVIMANMDTLVSNESAVAMSENGAIACLHRFQSILDNVKQFHNVFHEKEAQVMCSIGVGNTELERAEALFDAGCNTLVLDLAHGASMGAVKQVKALRELLGYETFNLIVGNFATGESVLHFIEHLNSQSIQAVKVGVGPGSRCSTRGVTGCGYPQLSAIMDISKTFKNTDIKVIGDGGMNTTGDVCKSLAAGAHLVMSGKFFAGCEECPGEMVWKDRNGIYQTKDIVFPRKANLDGTHTLITDYPIELPAYKKYRGSASRDSYLDQGKLADHRAPEGESTFVPCNGPIRNVLQEINGGIRSSFSYVGAKNLEEYHQKTEFVRVTVNTVIENGTRNF
jgi:IMP dehydrogenase